MRRQPTVRIDQGYRVDSTWEALALTGRAARRVSAAAWRYRTELSLVAAVLLVRILTGRQMPGGPAWAVTSSTAVTLLLWPASRRLLFGRLRCARTRRRLLACMAETRVATSAGRLPLVLRSRVTPAGERLTFGLFPGQSAELLVARVEELRASARARDVTVTRDSGRADRVVIDVIRRDALAGPALPSPLLAYATALHDTRAAAPAPVQADDLSIPDSAEEAAR